LPEEAEGLSIHFAAVAGRDWKECKGRPSFRNATSGNFSAGPVVLPRNGSWASRPVATRVNCEPVNDAYQRGLKPAFAAPRHGPPSTADFRS